MNELYQQLKLPAPPIFQVQQLPGSEPGFECSLYLPATPAFREQVYQGQGQTKKVRYLLPGSAREAQST